MYRFGSALAEVFDFVEGMSVGSERVFSFDEFSVNNTIIKFRARLSDVGRDNDWVFVSRRIDGSDSVMVRRIK